MTVVLGAIFLAGTAREWYGLIVEHGLTIGTNLFGTTFYSLVGLHASHVTSGSSCWRCSASSPGQGALRRRARRARGAGVLVLAFVDAVWVVVFTVVYWCGAMTPNDAESARATAAIELPAPTAWPMVLALGVTLIFAGLVTNRR